MAHDIDSTRIRSLATYRDTKGINAVRHINSVFHEVLKLVPWARFDQLVARYGSDDLVRKFTTRHQFTALLFGQLGGGSSLREIEAAMASHGGRLYHCGARAPKRSTFADANRLRDARIFGDLFKAMLGTASPGFRRKLGDAVRLIDATGLHLAGVGAQWARFSTQVCAPRPMSSSIRPGPASLSRAERRQRQRHQRRQRHADRGRSDLRLRPRLLRLRVVGAARRARLPAGDAVQEEHTARARPRLAARPAGRRRSRPHRLPARPPGGNRKNPMADAVREIVVTTQSGKTLRILSNDLDAPAQELADLYKRRWQIELFFRTMKQTLKLASFLGRSENAVRIQVAVALIAFLLLSRLRQMAKEKLSVLELARLDAPISCTEKTSRDLNTPRPQAPSTPANSTSTGASHQPDSRGLDPAIQRDQREGLRPLLLASQLGWPGQAHGCPVHFD